MRNQISKNLAYWIGVAQSDGSLQKYTSKNRKSYLFISVQVGKSSLPMLNKFQKLSKKLFDCKAKIFKLKTREVWQYRIGVKKLLHSFKQLNIKIDNKFYPPNWTIANSKFFGAYLAGLIDGDGDIRIKRKKYPQCVIRIAGNSKQLTLSKVIRRKLRCSTSITKRTSKRYSKRFGRTIKGTWFDLEFLVSSKNQSFVKQFILPFLQLDYKRDKVENYLT